MLIRNIMTTKIAVLTPNSSLKQAAALLVNSGLEGVLVVDDSNRLIGLVSQLDFVKAIVDGTISAQQHEPIKKIMSTDIVTVQEHATFEEMQQKVNFRNHQLFPVVDTGNRPIGIVTRPNLIAYLSENSLLMSGELNAILNSVYNGVIVTNEQGIVTLFNDTAAAITGLNKENVLGKFVDEVIPNTGLRRVFHTGIAELNKYFSINNCHVITAISPILQGEKIMGVVAICQDVTKFESITAELENIKDLKSTLETAIESIFEGIVVVDKKGFITMLNRAYGAFLGVDPHQAIGKHVTTIIPNTRMHIVAQEGKTEIAAVQKIHKNNSIVTRIPITKDGETVGAVGKVLFKDIKELKMLFDKINKLKTELEYYKQEFHKIYGGKYTFNHIIGNSEKMEWLKSFALKSAKGTSSVLILGESGTGKEVFAHAIHYASPRHKQPFIKINCAAVPEPLLESELFGYDDGAFTGARKGGKLGKFELANGGTIFLDEIGDMPLAMQVKLLRVLQEKEIERVGGTQTTKIDVRIIAATNRDLEKMIEQGTFRQDLYYRLNIIALNIPPLRERREDIPLLCDFLLNKINNQIQHCVESISPKSMEFFMNYDWPGNIRELENILERAVNIIDDETVILPEHLPPIFKKYKHQDEKDNLADLTEVVHEAEKQAIYNALAAANGNKSQAAKLLGINRSGFYQRLRKYNIQQ